MFAFRQFVLAPSMVLLMGGTAHAALTANQLWENWKSGAASAGITLSAAKEESAEGVLTLEGLSFSAEGMGSLNIPELTMTEDGDGTVVIVPSEKFEAISKDDFQSSIIAMTHDGLVIVAGFDEDGDITYGYAADALRGTVAGEREDFMSEGATITDAGSFSIEAIEGGYYDYVKDLRNFSLMFQADTIETTTKSSYAQSDLVESQTSTLEQLNFAFDLSLPVDAQGAIVFDGDFDAVLAAGGSVGLTMTHGPSQTDYETSGAEGASRAALTAADGSLEFVFDQESLRLALVSHALRYADLPTEGGDEALEESALKALNLALQLPSRAVEAAEDYQITLGIEDLILASSLFGGAAQGGMSFEPLQVNVDLNGKTKLDLISSAFSSMMGMPMIPEIESLNIEAFDAAIGESSLETRGALTFDNSLGAPSQLGKISVKAVAIAALLEKGRAMGLLSEEDVAGAQMALDMFFVEGSEPDTLVSEVEAKEGGAIFINGEQFQ